MHNILSGAFLIENDAGYVSEIYIKKVIYNDPVTIVFWNDGTKTTTKCCKDDKYNPESGLMHCIVKKLAGKTYYSNLLFNWLPEFQTNTDGHVNYHKVIELKEVRKKELKQQ